jgi:hypothetical protein
MRARIAGACVALMVSGCAETRPGPATGTWSGTIAGTGPDAFCSGPIRMMVSGGRADGTYKIGYNARRAVTGTVDAQGTFRSDDGAIGGRFGGDDFAGSFPNTQSANDCGGTWRIRMSREQYK